MGKISGKLMAAAPEEALDCGGACMTNVLETMNSLIGIVKYSDWLMIDQDMIDKFADATLDRQYIHVDLAKAAETPFGTTIAHGFLTLSLLAHLQGSIPDSMPDTKMLINYGLDRLRFINPVRSGSRVRLASKLVSITERTLGQFQQIHEGLVEIEGEDKPALITNWITLFTV